jgi:hypothetical protein
LFISFNIDTIYPLLVLSFDVRGICEGKKLILAIFGNNNSFSTISTSTAYITAIEYLVLFVNSDLELIETVFNWNMNVPQVSELLAFGNED